MDPYRNETMLLRMYAWHELQDLQGRRPATSRLAPEDGVRAGAEGFESPNANLVEGRADASADAEGIGLEPCLGHGEQQGQAVLPLPPARQGREAVGVDDFTRLN